MKICIMTNRKGVSIPQIMEIATYLRFMHPSIVYTNNETLRSAMHERSISSTFVKSEQKCEVLIRTFPSFRKCKSDVFFVICKDGSWEVPSEDRVRNTFRTVVLLMIIWLFLELVWRLVT